MGMIPLWVAAALWLAATALHGLIVIWLVRMLLRSEVSPTLAALAHAVSALEARIAWASQTGYPWVSAPGASQPYPSPPVLSPPSSGLGLRVFPPVPR